MARRGRAPTIGAAIFMMFSLLLGLYFTFAAVQGDYGLFRRIQIQAEAQVLRGELAALQAEVKAVENKTRRLSDTYLDLDLLDQQAREILGLIRSDEIVID
ncbi:MAG: septum formation initiator family protein [Pseudomonadota bacterium]